MKIIDSNILIYAYQEDYKYLRKLFLDKTIYFSEISKLETLGFHKIKQSKKVFYNTIFENSNVIAIDSEIIDFAIKLKQKQKMAIGDALIAATALIFDLEIITRNTKDFEAIEGLKTINPIL